ncbi:MAG TPA: recombinase family protein [Nitrospira sp.]|nr:recombinase family protein [Nitrospira sp.]
MKPHEQPDPRSKRAALYYRVSTSDQSTAMQEGDLRRFAEARGFTMYDEYRDTAFSGATKNRPALDRLMEDARKRRFDVVLVRRFDRFARSTTHLLSALNEFRRLSIDFISYNENMDTSSPMGEAMFTIVAAITKLERDIIRERVAAGVRQALKKRRSWGRRKIEETDPTVCTQILELRRQGLGMAAIGKQIRLSSRTVWRILRGAEASPHVP